MKMYLSTSSVIVPTSRDKYVTFFWLLFALLSLLLPISISVCSFFQIIQRTYKTNFGKDLIEDIRSETSGNFEKLLVALLTPIVDFYVEQLHDAMAGIGTDEDVLIEVLCTMSNYEIHTIKHAYERRKFIELEWIVTRWTLMYFVIESSLW